MSTPPRYSLLTSLGKGGMGEVFLADDTQLGRKVAIKFLTEALEADPKARERLHREARSAAALDHPFICKIHEIAEIDGRTGIVMEHVPGETLQALLRRSPPPAARALEIAGEIAEALEAAHQRRVVHRDLKPSNVMLTEQGHVKVMDFGLAKTIPAAEGVADQAETIGPITDSGVRVGTPGYMSPEQLLGAEADARSDIFAFGVLLYELLAGLHPFTRSSPSTTMAAVLRETAVPLGQYVKQVSTATQVTIDRLLAKDSAERYQSFTDVRVDLRRLLDETSTFTPAPVSESAATPAVARTPYVGRHSEQAELARLLDEAIAGRGGLVFVGGEPGVGKTRIAEELLKQARQRGCLAQTGHCYEMEGTPPFIPWVEMVERSARIVPKAALREALGDAAAEVARLVPELRQLFPDLPPPVELPPDQQRRYLFNNFLAFLDRAARVSPHAVLIDDLHWADESTLQLLQHIAPHLDQMPMLVVGTYRDVDLEAERPFARTLETLTRQRLAQKIALKRLDQARVGELLAAMAGQPAPEPLVEAVFRETEGNPFFVEEVYQHLAEEGKLFDDEGGWRADLRVEELDVPEGIKLVIGRRIQRLSKDSRQLLTMAAVVGRSFDLPLLTALGDDEDAVLTALEDAEAAQLLRTVSAGRVLRWEFAHGLIRQTLEGALSLPRRQRAHLRVAEAMEQVYGDRVERHAADLAHHLYQAGAAADPQKTVRFLTLAGDKAADAGAFDEAELLYDDALSAEDERDQRCRAELHAKRGRALRSLDRGDEAEGSLRAALEAYEALNDRAAVADVIEDLVWALGMQGRLGEAQEVASTALRRLPEADATRCRLLTLSAMMGSAAGDGQAVSLLADAQALADTLGDRTLVDWVRNQTATLRYVWMQVRDGSESGQHAVSALRSEGNLWRLADYLWVTAGCLWMHGRSTEAAALVDELGPLAERLGNTFATWAYDLHGALVDLSSTGDLAAAERRMTAALERAQAANFMNVGSNHRQVAMVRFFRGERDAAEASARLAADKEQGGTASVKGTGLAQLAVIQASAGDPTVVEALPVDALFPRAGQLNTIGSWDLLSAYLQGMTQLGRRAELSDLYPLTLEALETGVVMARDLTMWEAVAGMAAAGGDQWDAADTHFQTALRQAEEIPNKIGQPEVRRAYARMLIDRDAPGDKDKARTLLDEAIELYSALGMPKHLDLAKELQARV